MFKNAIAFLVSVLGIGMMALAVYVFFNAELTPGQANGEMAKAILLFFGGGFLTLCAMEAAKEPSSGSNKKQKLPSDTKNSQS